MELADVLDPDRILVQASASSKKSLLEKASELLSEAPDSAEARDIFESLCQRERLGSTGLGHAVAIPHGRVSGQSRVAGAVIQLANGIDFDAPDQQPVKLFICLAVPAECTDVHLKLLAEIARRFSDENIRRQTLEVTTCEDMFSLLSCDPEEQQPAAERSGSP